MSMAHPLIPHDPALPRLPNDCDPFDFVNKGCYFTDQTVMISYEKAVQNLSDAGPVFINRKSQRVWFTGLDWGAQCEMIATMTRQISDKEDYIRNMPKGQWPDSKPNTSGKTKDAGNGSDQMSKFNECVADDAVSISSMEVVASEDSSVESPDTAGTTPDTSTARSDQKTLRKDSARSSEHTQVMRYSEELQIPHSSQTGSESSHRRTSTQRAHPHETISFVDELRTVARRRTLGIEDSWHPSKWRVAPTLAEMNPSEVTVQAPRLRKIGSVKSPLSEGITFPRP